jgi:hypothetical protein
MTGQPIRGGTAFSDILLDEVALMRLQQGLPPSMPLEGNAPPPTEDDEDEEVKQDDICSSTSLRMNLTIPETKAVLMEEPDVEFVIIGA